MTSDVERRKTVDVLAGNTFGIVDSNAPVEDKMLRLVALIPMALEVEREARETIVRLRSAVEDLQLENARLTARGTGQ